MSLAQQISRWKDEKVKRHISNSDYLLFLLFMVFLTGCSALEVGGEIEAGRKALRYGDPNVALAHFQRAAELDPDYLLDFSAFDQGVWTYVGRSYYALEKLPEARQALEQARSRHERDHLARLYLGLVLARTGDRRKGLREIEAGLRGLGDWLEEVQRTLQEGRFWDPDDRLRSEIQRDLAVISREEVKWSEVIARGEWLGQEFEEEIDLVRRDQSDERPGYRLN